MTLTSAATKEIARKERERLKAQDKYKKDQLEKLRAEQYTLCHAELTITAIAAGQKSRQPVGFLTEASRGLPAFCS